MWLNYNKLKITLLVIITLLAFYMRLVDINRVPAGFTWDEAALGYNAYSILNTGRDEYGDFLPFIFKSFGDYKPGVYIYLAVPFIALFGLTELATRLPSIILGSLMPILVFLISRKLLSGKKDLVGLVAAFFVAFSPWFINFSRGAWETNISFFENLLALYFLIKSLENRKFLAISAILLCSSIFTYQSAKLFCVFLFSGFLFIFNKKFFTKKSYVTYFSIVLISITVLISIAEPITRSRLVVLSQYSYKRSAEEVNGIVKQDYLIPSSFEFSFFHSENLSFIKTVGSRYLNYYNPKFLFVSGPSDGRQGALNYGMMQLFELPFLLIGLFFLIRNNLLDKKVILLWLLIAPIPAALSRDVSNTVRALPLAFALEYISALGLFEFFRLIQHRKMVLIPAFAVISLGFLFSLGFFVDRYFIHNPIHSSKDWLYGHKEAISYIQDNGYKYKDIYFTTKFNEPYIFYLFYTKYDPAKYQKQAKLINNRGIDVGEVPKIDNIHFNALYWPHDRSQEGNLYIGTWLEIPDTDIDPKESKLVKTIKFLDDTIAFKFVETH